MNKPKRKEITEHLEIDPLDGTLNEILYTVQQLILKYGDDAVINHVGQWAGDEVTGDMTITRLETKDEYQERLYWINRLSWMHHE